MERRCLRCGKPLKGRSDKKFCNDDCRTDYHNDRRRAREKELRAVNRILSNNWKILSAQLREGHRDVPAGDLSARNFNFDIYTASRLLFPGRRIYWCYNCSYRISRTGIVHIRESACQNNAYL